MPTSGVRNAAEPAPKKHNTRWDATSIWPFTSTSWHDNAHGSWPIPQSFPGTTTAQESRGAVCGTEESNRIAPLALTTHEVRSGVVLPGSGCAEYQAPGAVPHREDNPCSGSHHLVHTITT